MALTPAQRTELEALRAGDMAALVVHESPRPRVDLPFRDLFGNRVTLADYSGKVVLLNLWATWCPPCRAEMPALDRLAAAMEGPDFDVIALATDSAGTERVKQFLDGIAVAHLEVMQDRGGDLRRRYAAPGLPVTLILDREGREIARLLGDAAWDSPEARALIGRIIEMTGAAGPGVKA